MENTTLFENNSDLRLFQQGHPLQNNVILHCVFENLKHSEKITARLVCQSWNDETMRRIKKGVRCSDQWIALASKKLTKALDFKKLNKLLYKSKNPELLMEFINVERINDAFNPEAQICLQNYGIYVKSLSFQSITELNARELHTVLYQLCPNLLYLQFNELRSPPRNEANSTEKFQKLEWNRPLKSLQLLILENDRNRSPIEMSAPICQLFSEIIKVSTCLNYLHVSLEVTQYFLQNLKTDDFNGVQKPLQQLKTLVYSGSLKGINYDTRQKAEYIVKQFLGIVAESIEKLHFYCIPNEGKTWNFPIMKKLKFFHGEPTSFIPNEMFRIHNLHRSMPNLEWLEMRLVGFGSSTPHLRANRAVAVDTLFEATDLRMGDKNKICFPNLTTLRMNVYMLSYLSMQKICVVFPNLKSLKVRFRLPKYNLSDETTFLGNISKTIGSLKHLEFLATGIFGSAAEAKEWMTEPKLKNQFYEDFRPFFNAPRLKTFYISMVTEFPFPEDLVNNLSAEFPSVKVRYIAL